MPPALASRSPLELLALACRRGDDDLGALAALARGETIAPEALTALTRAGLVQGGRLPAKLLVPVLALEASLGLAGADLLDELLALLKRSPDARARDSFLLALADQLEAEIAALARLAADDRNDRPLPLKASAALEQVLEDLELTVSRLGNEQADPALRTRVAALCAQLVEALAGSLTLRRRRVTRTARPPRNVLLDGALAGRLLDGLLVRAPRVLSLPSCAQLARAAAGDRLAPASAPAEARTLAPAGERADRGALEAALRSAEPLHELYGGVTLEQALRRHVQLLGLGREPFERAGIVPTGERSAGPAPLAWTSAFARGEQRASAQIERSPAEAA